jgi:hypothetical protein
MNKIVTLELPKIEESLEELLLELILPIDYLNQVRKLVLSKDELNISLAFQIINTIYPEILFQTLNYTKFNWNISGIGVPDPTRTSNIKLNGN